MSGENKGKKRKERRGEEGKGGGGRERGGLVGSVRWGEETGVG